MNSIFEERLGKLIEMFYYTDSSHERFLIWIRARPVYNGLEKEMDRLKDLGIIWNQYQ